MDLSDISLESVNDILSSLSDKDMENLTKLASDFFSGTSQTNDAKKDEKPKSGIPFDIDMDTVMKIASVMNRLTGQPEDPRCRLLQDLKPMLSRECQKKVDTAIQMMRMISLMPLLKEFS